MSPENWDFRPRAWTHSARRRLPVWRFLTSNPGASHPSSLGTLRVAFDSAMTRYALRFSAGSPGPPVDDDQEVARFKARGDRDVYVFDFSPDGRYLASTHVPGSG